MTVYKFNLRGLGQKIEAIKEFRALTGVGLKEAKQVIEGMPVEYSHLYVKTSPPESKYGEWLTYKGFGEYMVIEVTTSICFRGGECEWWAPGARFTHYQSQYKVCADPNYYCYRGDTWEKHQLGLPSEVARHEFFEQCHHGWKE